MKQKVIWMRIMNQRKNKISWENKPIEIKENTNKNDNRIFYSPLVKSIAKSEGLSFDELDSISGTGLNNRVNKTDVLEYLKSKKNNTFKATWQIW